MRKITNYKITYQRSMDTLAASVALDIEDGWQPFARVWAGHKEGFTQYCQTMVKFEVEV
jgi:hypothetical protein